jgi:hypothetical protein
LIKACTGDPDAWELAEREPVPLLAFQQERADKSQLVDFFTLSDEGMHVSNSVLPYIAAMFLIQLLCRKRKVAKDHFSTPICCIRIGSH